jgi:outer membrane protein insertion porin family
VKPHFSAFSAYGRFRFWLSIVLGGCATMAPAAAFAQAAEQAGAIRSILVEGNQRIEARTIQSYLLFSPGDPFDPGKIDLSLKTLFATGLFSDIAIDRSGDDVVVRVVENPMVNRVIFEGNKALKEDKFKEEIQLAPRSSLTSARVMQDVNRMMEMYRRAGRFSAKITPQYKPLPQNRVDVIFVIEEGPTTGVRSISFLGNNTFSDARLRSEIVTRQSRLWNFFSANDNYDSSRLEYDREVLRKLYQDNGYYDFRIISAVAEMTPDEKDFFITFTIEEGEQYSFGDIKVETSLSKLDAGMLTSLTPIHSGQIYRGQAIEQTIDALTYAAGVAGYAFVDIRPIVVADPETRKVDITFVVDEGPRVYINRINIVGNTATLDRVIRREMRVSEGNAFNRVLIDRSRNRIRALGFFKDVTIEETPTADGERTDINVKVEEQSTGELAFSAGYSSSENLQFDVSMTQANLLGTGRSASLRLATSSLQQTATLNFTEPRFLDRSLSAGIQSWLTRYDYSDYSSYEAVSYGIGASMGFPLTDRTQLGLRYRLQYDQVDYADRNIIIDRDGNLVASSVRDDDGVARAPQASDITSNDQLLVDVCDERYLFRESSCSSEADALSSVVGYSLNWDGRNDPIEPTRGMEFQLAQEVAGLGGDVQTFKTEASAAAYYGLTKSLRASLRLSAGFIEPWGDDNTVRINNRFFRGGSSFRGFDVAGLGPRQVVRMYDPDTGEEVSLTRGSALGGNAYYQATAELTVPNFLPEEYGIKSALFIDAGGLGSLYDQDVTDPIEYTDSSTGYDAIQYTETDPSLRAAAGISFMWDSPFGPLRFDFAHILKSEDYDRTQSFRFSTSTRF